jgi:hypothetical protein
MERVLDYLYGYKWAGLRNRGFCGKNTAISIDWHKFDLRLSIFLISYVFVLLHQRSCVTDVATFTQPRLKPPFFSMIWMFGGAASFPSMPSLIACAK